MKKLILVALTLIGTLGIFLSSALPASACVTGLSPGYWKNHTDWPAPFDSSLTSGTFIDSVCGAGPHVTFMAALQTGKNSALFGSPDADFLRQAVAQILNEATFGGNPVYTENLVKAAYGGSGTTIQDHWQYPYEGQWLDKTIEQWKNWLEGFNSL